MMAIVSIVRIVRPCECVVVFRFIQLVRIVICTFAVFFCIANPSRSVPLRLLSPPPLPLSPIPLLPLLHPTPKNQCEMCFTLILRCRIELCCTIKKHFAFAIQLNPLTVLFSIFIAVSFIRTASTTNSWALPAQVEECSATIVRHQYIQPDRIRHDYQRWTIRLRQHIHVSRQFDELPSPKYEPTICQRIKCDCQISEHPF